ncbi:receptor-type tyrosine-protein phosphatase H-like isoform X2 [Sebastes umbrosus]|uniref:receptor-type tyrosine-protein phosphatase H-like isoform X2 n=1 Tax=Sebastes umbrosus TaxID=72105 RepID=UPI00189E8BF4|nr:receptor-type tyrosine-protein phosphatase H-like isoform X2 [Sebastes umbrosus]
MKPSSSKITSDHFLLCVFLSLLWGSTDSNATSSAPDTTLTSSTNPTETTTRLTTLTTLQTTKAPPEDVRNVTVLTQDESSITLKWDKVDNILTYILQYHNNGSLKEDFITASEEGSSVTHLVTPLSAGRKYNFTLITAFEGVNSTGHRFDAVTAPLNAVDFKSLDQTETSITLQWQRVGTISNYVLVFNGSEINVPASAEQVNHTISELTSGTEYNVTLFTVFETVKSSGVNLSAVTAPENVKNVNVSTQNESSITLMWDKVNNILTYFLQYDNNGSLKEDFIPASEGVSSVTHVVTPLSAGRKYNFTLITASKGVNSTGYRFDAVTAPLNAEDFKSLDQTETSITLQWKKVPDIPEYILVFNGSEIIVNASSADVTVTKLIPGLINGTKYDFTLFTVFGNIRSRGLNLSAATAPRDAEDFRSVDQNETSITLQWQIVGTISNYVLVFNGSEINVHASAEQVTHTISELTSGTKYNVALFTVFETVRSRGVNLFAATAPENVKNMNVSTQNESSITLMWDKVNSISTYFLQYDNKEDPISESQDASVTHVVTSLTAGKKYNFTVITLFEGVNSTGRWIAAVTAPLNAEGFKSVDQNETSITLQWQNVGNIPYYILVFNGSENNVTASAAQVTHTISELTSGTEYYFRLFTVFENIRSSGVNYSPVTAPRNTDVLESVGQNETSITLQWKKVDGIPNYTLVFNETMINVKASEGLETVTHTILGLITATKYNITLFTVFKNVRSSGLNTTAFTAPGNVNNVTVLTQNESSITLTWNKVNNISTYFLQNDNNGSSTEVNGDTFYQKASVIYEVSSLNAGTKYNFILITGFEKVNSTGFSFNAVTVPSMLPLVNVTERSVTSITLTWQRENKDWDYFFEMNGVNPQLLTNRALDVESRSFTSLQPGTAYRFSVITVFSGLNSTAYEDFTVTAIDCTNVTWHVTTSSIQGRVQGLFSNATATSKSQTHVSPGGNNVSFTGLYPGDTYNVSLEYEIDSKTFLQCIHEQTIIPPPLSGRCEYWAAGYSVLIVLDEPAGVWTSVEVNGKEYPEYGNGEERLRIYISGFQPAKTYKMSLTSLSGTERSNKPLVILCHTDPRGVIAGAVFAVLLFCVLVCLAVFIFFKRPDIISRKKQFIGGSKQPKKKCKAISVAKFPDHFHQLGVDENRGFSQEYESLSPVGTEQTRKAATEPENKARNRFNNVLPYDWCRVKLTSSPNGSSDYINANYMPGYNSNREYIATQGPLPSTVNDFWRMIWEQRVNGIVMVTNCTEGGKTKCQRYWPADSKPCLNGELLVTIRSEQEEPYWTLREFSVKHSNNSGERTVKHFHFTAWPDHGVPQGTEALIQFRGLVRRHIEREGAGAPTVVHCSAGVGRTGTIIALDVLLQQLEKERAVGINGFVHKMRLSRPHMVQTESQYVFLHQSIMDRLQPNEKTEENIYENSDMIYVNATALRELR